jgi:hypothetical protein
MPPLPWRTKPQPDPDRTYLVMASRLPLRSRRTVPRFLRLTLSVVRQLERTDGLVGYTLLAPADEEDLLDPVGLDRPAAPRRLRPGHAASGRHPQAPAQDGPVQVRLLDGQGVGPPLTWEEATDRLMSHSAAPGSG